MHLDAHSWYSFHFGVSAPEQLVQQAAELGYESLGLCDYDGTYGLLNFYKAAVRHGIKPIMGLALTPANDSSAHVQRRQGNNEKQNAGSLRVGDKTWQAADARNGVSGLPMTAEALVIARNRDGYSSLCSLAAGRQLDPDWNIVEALSIAAENCFVVSDRVLLLQRLVQRIGPERLFVRMSPDYGPAYRAEQINQRKLAERFGLSAVACTDVSFLHPQDQAIHHLLRAIGQNTSLQLAQGVRPRNHYFAAPTELPGLYYSQPEALRMAQRLAERCDVELILGKWHFPEFPLHNSIVPPQALREMCVQGLQWRFKGTQTGEHFSRLDMELAVIDKLGYSSYFLFVKDIVNEAARRGIPCLGRGSAANSLVSYILGLTPIDPLKYGMYFERFLNPDRTSPPDIDIDFNWRRRDEILQYVYDRWGNDRVALISTHVTYRAKSALRETAKVFGLGDREISEISKFLPGMNAGKLTTVAAKLPEMQGVDLTVEPYKHVLPLAARLAGKPRHLGIHCGGIVIAPRLVTEFTGLQRAAKGFVVTQYEMHSVEAIGLIKIDLLGNRSLGVFEDTLACLKRRGIASPVNSLARLTTDPPTVAMIREGRTMGCFYIESPAMRSLLQRLHTDTFLGLTAASSIIRPGVAESGMMQEFIRRHNGQTAQLPSHPLMDKLLEETHGVMVYQEDVIRVAHEFAGFTPAQADILRRSMSGKLRSADAMNQLRDTFLEGCERKGVDGPSALEIWRQLSSFSGYSFCKAHSASFATLSYQVAYLKAHYPAEFMAAVISNGGGFYSAQTYLSECRRLGLHVLPPDVNQSGIEYRPEIIGAGDDFNAVRIGLGVIKNLPQELLQRIPTERERNGRFTSLSNFITRIKPQRCQIEVLILSGACNELGASQPALLWQAGIEQLGQSKNARHNPRQLNILASESSQAVATVQLTDYSEGYCWNLEREHLGMIVSRYPIETYQCPERGIVRAIDIPLHAGRRVRLLGWCIATKRVDIMPKSQKRDPLSMQAEHLDLPEDWNADDEERSNPAADLGLVGKEKGRSTPYHYYDTQTNAMKFMSMEDATGTYEATLFPQTYSRFAPLTRFAGPFVVQGMVEENFGTYSITVDRLDLLET